MKWFRWMARQRHILHNPASELELPRIEHRLPKTILTIAEMEQVLLQPNINDPLGLRDRALMETLYSTGMRRLEMANLTLYDLDTERGTLPIRQGKGKKDRVIPIGDRAAAWIDKYIRESRPQLVMEPDDHTVFLSNAGEPFCLDHLSDLVRTHVDAAGIGKRGACHMSAFDGNHDAGKRSRHPLHPADARPRRYQNNPDLHSGLDPPAEADPRGHSPGKAGKKTHRWRELASSDLNDRLAFSEPFGGAIKRTL
jgi:integrase